LVDIERDGACFLIELINNKWVNKLKLIPEEDQSNTFYGMAIGDGFVVVGGRNDLSTTNGTDRFVVYVWPL